MSWGAVSLQAAQAADSASSAVVPVMMAPRLVRVDGAKGKKSRLDLVALLTRANQADSPSAKPPEGLVVHSAVAILLGFSSNPQSCSAAAVDSILFRDSRSIDQFYREDSFGQVGFDGKVIGPYDLGNSGGKCDYKKWSDEADEILKKKNIDLSSFDHRIYVLPPASADLCPDFSGMGTIGGHPGVSWIVGAYCDQSSSYAHELGHNLGMDHSSAGAEEYGDDSDAMGNWYFSPELNAYALRQSNGPHKVQMGWVPVTRMIDVKKSGEYRLGDLEQSTEGIQVVRLFRHDGLEPYYFSYRRPIGQTDSVGLPAAYQNKLSVHAWGAGDTSLLGEYPEGSPFVDTANQITVTPISHDDHGLGIRIDLGQKN
jgi:hypothetical protein